jgi:hypothetical protein
MLPRSGLISLLALALFAPGALASDSAAPAQILDRSQDAMRGGGDGREVTPALKELAVVFPKLRGADREAARRLLARPTLGEAAPNEERYSVAEAPPLCTTHFCIHYVATSDDRPPTTDSGGIAGTPDYVETMAAVFEEVYAFENGHYGWQVPKADGTRGCPANAIGDCLNKTDVYIKNVGGRSVYGYAAPDPGQQTFSQHAFLVMDNDYAEPAFRQQYGDNPLPPMQVTAAHEYNHVLQFAYDVAQDTWMFEATATWMEDEVYTDVNDYLQYVVGWSRLTDVPMTNFSSSGDEANAKAYGAAVWNRWLEARHGPDVVRNAWEVSRQTDPPSFAPGAYDRALRSRGSSFAEAFAEFTADTAEWRASNSPFEEGSTFPDIPRERNVDLLPNVGGAKGMLDHTAYFLINVPPTDVERLKLVMEIGSGTSAALALVGREGDTTGGTVETRVTRLRRGGTGIAVLENPSRFARITAVVMNSDTKQRGYSRLLGDWVWRKDSQPLVVRASTDFTPPNVMSRSPGGNADEVSRNTRVKASFSEELRGLGSRTVSLRGPGGRKVKARVKVSKGRRLTIDPRRRLGRRKVYTVKVSSSIRDLGGNRLPASARIWRFRTDR